ncbi:hypothetical protein KKB44_06505 [Candidatus Micrarchaeota archaeon]|nr:hypothetical protein [Candidatus Micrarchaeota archaeon]
MRRYPYFITDAVLLLIFLAIVPITVIYNTVYNYATLLLAGAVLVFVLLNNRNKFLDFKNSIKNIRGLRSWETDFFSFGAILFDYKGQEIRYSSSVGATQKNYIPVNYTIELKNNKNTSFELNRNGKWLGEFQVKGNRKSLDKLKQDITLFNKKYAISHMSNSNGLLKISVTLDFIASEPAPADKLEDMAHFLKDLLEFGYNINKKIKKR